MRAISGRMFHAVKNFIFSVFASLIFFWSSGVLAATYSATDIVMTPGENASELNFNWYSTSQTNSLVQIALKADMSGSTFPAANATSFYTTTASAASGYYSNKATATALSAETEYVYRLGDGSGNWSDNYFVITYPDETFSFIAVGDPQIGASGTSADTAGWADTINQAVTCFPEAAFIVSAGDQVETRNNESQFSGFFSPDELRRIPVAPALGNHDNGAANTGYHFNLPNLSGSYGVTSPGSADYYFTHGNALFVILNSNNTSGAGHEAFISQAVAAHPDLEWRIAVFHHDIYGSSFHALESSVRNLRAALFPVFDQYEFDVVVTGHDHSYSRSYVLYGDIPQEDQTYDHNGNVVDPDGTVYFTLNSASGSKYYSLNASQADYCAYRSQIYVPTFSHVRIESNTLTIDTYRTDTMTAIDSFGIVKTGGTAPPENTVSRRISSAMDDVEESVYDGAIYEDSSDLELVYDSYVGGDQVVGLRFADLVIPSGATITAAYIQFTCDETDSGTANLTIEAEAADSAAAFTLTDYNVSDRGTTTAQVSWSVPDWDTVGAAGAAQRTPDLSDIVQEVVDRSGWASGNAIAMIITGDTGGTRHAESYDGSSAGAPLLYIEYTDSGEIVDVTGVALDSDALSLEVGDMAMLTAAVLPPDATDPGVTWTTGNASVATVTDGWVTAVGEGTAVVTVTTDDGGYTDDCLVTVSEYTPGGGFVLDTGAITSGGEYLIKAGGDDHVLSISAGGSLSKTAVSVVEDTIILEDENAVWILTESGDGYVMQNKGTGDYLTIESSGGWWPTYSLSLTGSASIFDSTTGGDYKYLYMSFGRWWVTSYFVSYTTGDFGVSRQSADGAMLLYLNSD